MGILGTLLTFPVSLPLHGVMFIAEKLQEKGMEDLLDDRLVQQQLMELELRRDLGEIDDVQYATREEELLRQLDAIAEYREQQEKGEV